MKKIMITLDDCLYAFYAKIGENVGGVRPEKVMADVLLKFAGELSLKAIHEKT